MSPDLKDVLNFMAMCFESNNLGYSAMNTIRSALSTFICIDDKPVGSHPLIVRFLRGIFVLKPALPRNICTWDTSVVLQFLKTLSPVNQLNLKELTFKTVTLTALLTSQRCQSLGLIDIRNIKISKFKVKIAFGDLLKQTRPGYQLEELTIHGFPPDRRLCIVKVMKEYLSRTVELRGDSKQLFITTKKPFRPASTQTISRWVKTTLKLAGVDMEMFTPHSVRAASASNARQMNIPLKTIMKTAGWSNKCTFTRFYNKKVKKSGVVSQCLLNKTIDSNEKLAPCSDSSN